MIADIVEIAFLVWMALMLMFFWVSPRHLGDWLADVAIAFRKTYERGKQQ